MVVSYALLETLSSGLSHAGSALAADPHLPGLISGDADTDHAANHLADAARALTGTTSTTLAKTAEQTRQAAQDYARADKAFAN
jgi:hypothetical protein